MLEFDFRGAEVEEGGFLAEVVRLAITGDEIVGFADVGGVYGLEGAIDADGDGGVPGCHDVGAAGGWDE